MRASDADNFAREGTIIEAYGDALDGIVSRFRGVTIKPGDRFELRCDGKPYVCEVVRPPIGVMTFQFRFLGPRLRVVAE